VTLLKEMTVMKFWILLFVFFISSAGVLMSNEQEKESRLRVRPFHLRQVRLLEGPLKAAAERNQTFLRGLELDRMLHNFRLTAGLPTSAEPLGGWESPTTELRGHFVGHYLSACALMFASAGDRELKTKADMMVAELAKCQQKLGNGYLSAYPEELIDRVETTGKVWAPWYTLHKIYQGLIDVYEYTGNTQALDVVKKMAAWAKNRTDRLTDAQMQKMLNVEFGGMSESLFNLFAITNDPGHLALAQRFEKRSFLDPLVEHTDKLKGLHVNTHIPQVIGAARGYELTGDERYRMLSSFFWDQVVRARSYATGGTSNGEHWGSEPYHLSTQLGPTTEESCCSYNMLKLTSHLFCWDPLPAYADYVERTYLNSILPTQEPGTGMLMYYKPLGSGWYKTFGTPRNSFWCCTGTGVESFGRLASDVYYYDENGIFVNLFVPSEVRWAEQGMTLRQETSFPADPRTRFTIRVKKPLPMLLRIRIPEWSRKGGRVAINGQDAGITSSPGSYLVLQRTWKDGDRVDVEYQMELHLHPMPDNPGMAAIMYGPLVLAGKLTGDPLPDTLKYGPYGPALPPVLSPVLVTDAKDITTWIEPLPGRSLAFRTKGVGLPHDVELVPLEEIRDQRYAVYWNIYGKSAWGEAKKESEALAGAMIDRLIVGDSSSEMIHNVVGNEMLRGTDAGKNWIATKDWFSVSVNVLIDRPINLRFTYAKGDTGRAYAIQVDEIYLQGKPMARETTAGTIEEEYAIPLPMTHGRRTVIVTFRSQRWHEGKRVLGCEVYGGTGIN
jgi:uncharacterized protein